MKVQKLTYILGLAGPLIVIFGSLATALVYSGKIGENYSFLNHFISELGEVGVSAWAAVFNISLFVGGLCIPGFMLGVALMFRTWFGWLFGLIGLVTGVSGSLVGIFPMNNLEPHISVAMLFFRAALISSALFAAYVFFAKQDKFPRWTGIPAASISAITFVFLFIVKPVGSGGDMLEMLSAIRPEIWPSAILEWGMFIAVMVWVVATSISLLNLEKHTR